MKLEEIRAIARLRNIKPGNLSKVELIRTIQTHEGNFNCYGTADSRECRQTGCRWRGDCVAISNLTANS